MFVSDIDTMSSAEYHKWIAYSEVEPFGDIRNNIHTGIIASILVNQNLGKGQRPRTFNDFMLKTKEDGRLQNANEFASFLKSKVKKVNDNGGE